MMRVDSSRGICPRFRDADGGSSATRAMGPALAAHSAQGAVFKAAHAPWFKCGFSPRGAPFRGDCLGSETWSGRPRALLCGASVDLRRVWKLLH